MRIQMYQVAFDFDGSGTLIFRVPQDQVDSLIRILMFNNVTQFTVTKEAEDGAD